MRSSYCRHCGIHRADDPAIAGLCQPCADRAQYAAYCPECGRVPTGAEPVSDYDAAMPYYWPDGQAEGLEVRRPARCPSRDLRCPCPQHAELRRAADRLLR